MYKKIVDETSAGFAKSGKNVSYEHFDYSQHCKKSTAVLDAYINDMLKAKYLNKIGCYNEKQSIIFQDGQV